jgi:hypothetical protein
VFVGAARVAPPDRVWEALARLFDQLPPGALDRLVLEQLASTPTPPAAPVDARLRAYHEKAVGLGSTLPDGATATDLEAATRKLLVELGAASSPPVPLPSFTFGRIKDGLESGFTWNTWHLVVSDTLTDWPTIVKFLRHEWEHVEQYFSMARYLAVVHDSVDALERVFPILRRDVLAAAVEHRYDSASSEYAAARRLYESKFGSDSAQTSRVIQAQADTYRAMATADANYEAGIATPGTSAAERARLALERIRTMAAYAVALAEYHDLALEAPAYEREEQLDSLFNPATTPPEQTHPRTPGIRPDVADDITGRPGGTGDPVTPIGAGSASGWPAGCRRCRPGADGPARARRGGSARGGASRSLGGTFQRRDRDRRERVDQARAGPLWPGRGGAGHGQRCPGVGYGPARAGVRGVGGAGIPGYAGGFGGVGE